MAIKDEIKKVRDNVYELISDLNKHEISKEYFLEIRNLDRTDEYKNLSNVQRASRFIYLNRTCFNGLYRVNSQGQFNVPFGNYKNPRIVDENNLLNCSELLKNTEIKCADFSEILTKVKKGDFVYFDPPYDSDTSTFTSYTEGGFGKEEQIRLAKVFKELSKKIKEKWPDAYISLAISDRERRLVYIQNDHGVVIEKFYY